jgi:hypothetical protein
MNAVVTSSVRWQSSWLGCCALEEYGWDDAVAPLKALPCM